MNIINYVHVTISITSRRNKIVCILTAKRKPSETSAFHSFSHETYEEKPAWQTSYTPNITDVKGYAFQWHHTGKKTREIARAGGARGNL